MDGTAVVGYEHTAPQDQLGPRTDERRTAWSGRIGGRGPGKQGDEAPSLTAYEKGLSRPLAAASRASGGQPQPRSEFDRHRAHLLFMAKHQMECSIAQSVVAGKGHSHGARDGSRGPCDKTAGSDSTPSATAGSRRAGSARDSQCEADRRAHLEERIENAAQWVPPESGMWRSGWEEPLESVPFGIGEITEQTTPPRGRVSDPPLPHVQSRLPITRPGSPGNTRGRGG